MARDPGGADRSRLDWLGGRYEVCATAGSGGEGRVVQAFDHQHDRFVALKLRPAVGDRESLLAEVRVLLNLAPHPGLPMVRDDFFDGDDHVMVMEWVEGANLSQVL